MIDWTLKEIAGMIDHSLLHPTMTDDEMTEGCHQAVAYGMATVCVKPMFVKQAHHLVRHSKTKVCSVIGFPHGNNTTKIKVAETKLAILEGATEIDMVIHAGKVLSKDWAYIKKDITAVNKICVKNGAILKVIFENDFLPDTKLKIKLCTICNKVGVAFVKTSTGYGYVKSPQGGYTYQGATIPDVDLMRKYCNHDIQIKAAGGIRTLDDLLLFRSHGVTRIGATASVAMLEDAKKRLGLNPSDAIIKEVKGY
ncbi:MAG: deoxyribose-phosphate aldolase [Saprospiraceae bacterium]|jgi:deoxyribose-phosphate aldolase|nr:deoxyribose-phosphate aldolase [Saprospiraceae bacterium]MBK6478112.1 deoxyribose-phosphate aldolase [Saprospiraceae bacterium]MBK7373107.1 deoxyribose-phosphate aldolase [Saprospiraceae bacterium]MBK7608929.1 deoxyribose-phosphate aldolase [Saprospiraceae bacterium]MBK8513189.1 deoxyribose-phosphate aldolase [Saprospiraceae bacterium]